MKGQWIEYTQEQLEFVKAGSKLPRRESTRLFNEKFNTDLSISNIASLCKRKGWLTGRTGCFEKGNIPHPNAKPKGANSTSFKKGNKPVNYKSVNSERVNVEGYCEIKMAEGMHQWRLKQRVVYEEHHGVKLGAGDVIRFKDGDKLNCDIDNLELFNRGEHLVLNRLGVNGMPGEVKDTVKAIVRVSCKVSQLEKTA